ncbi:MAG: transketolase C-terminal domain-containing protein [Candidatus Helarchaeota archaeon]
MSKKMVLNGNHAAAYACKHSNVQVIAAYPITPQSPVTEKLSEFVENKELDAEYVTVESEHSAITVCIAASTTGARVFTASSANGLALMHEQLHWAAGARLPIVLACVNRAVAAPWNVWTDEQDSIAQRDTGWIQLYCEDNQEIYDTIIQAFKLAERVYAPVMVCYDGYILSHTLMPLLIEEQDKINKFLPPYKPHTKLDPNDPTAINLVTFPWIRHDTDKPGIERFGGYPEIRFRLQESLLKATDEFIKIDNEFGDIFKRKYGIYKEYKCDDAEYIIFGIGTIASEAQVSVDLLRKEGYKVGVLSLKLYRPFPRDQLIDYVKKHENVKAYVVFDRNLSYGYEGAVCSDFKAALYTGNVIKPIHNYLAGIGGRDVTYNQIKDATMKTIQQIEKGELYKEPEWINVYIEGAVRRQ